MATNPYAITAQEQADLEKQLKAELAASYGTQKTAAQSQYDTLMNELTRQENTAKTSFDASSLQLQTQQERDLADLRQAFENVQLQRGGGYNSWVHERGQGQESDLMREYANRLSDLQGARDTTLANAALNRELYARQLTDQLKALEAGQQNEYVARLLKWQQDRMDKQKDFEATLALRSSGGGGGGPAPDDYLSDWDIQMLLGLANTNGKGATPTSGGTGNKGAGGPSSVSYGPVNRSPDYYYLQDYLKRKQATTSAGAKKPARAGTK
jgi:hypothetical protein